MTEQTTGWRDISTAPKDGTRILVFVPPYGPFTAHNRFHDFGENQDRWHVAGLLNKDAAPTHWQPLPPPPGEDAAEHRNQVIQELIEKVGPKASVYSYNRYGGGELEWDYNVAEWLKSQMEGE